MPATVANRLHVSDAPDPLDYNGFPFQKSQSRNSFPHSEYGIQRNLFLFQANRKPSPQSTHIRSPDKTEHIQITAVHPRHHEFLPPHPDIFCNNALNHLISDYAASLVLQQERFEHRVPHPEVVEKIFSEVLKISRIFRFSGHCILKNAALSTGCYSIMGQNMGQTVFREISEFFSELFNP